MDYKKYIKAVLLYASECERGLNLIEDEAITRSKHFAQAS